MMCSVQRPANASDKNCHMNPSFRIRLPTSARGSKASNMDKTKAQFVEADRLSDAGDTRRAFRLWLACAKAGDVNCQLNVGYCYDTGRGVRRNVARAMYWYLRAHRRGDACATNNIGILYRERGDIRKAIEWLQRAIRAGSDDSALLLGEIYLQEKPDLRQARKYLTHVSDSDNVCEAAQERARELLKQIASR
jgi:TPR repeat protein